MGPWKFWQQNVGYQGMSKWGVVKTGSYNLPNMSMAWLLCSIWPVSASIYNRKALEEKERASWSSLLRHESGVQCELHVDNRVSMTSSRLWAQLCSLGDLLPSCDPGEAPAMHIDKGWVAMQMKKMCNEISYISGPLPSRSQGRRRSRSKSCCSFDCYFIKLSAFTGNHHVKYYQS